MPNSFSGGCHKRPLNHALVSFVAVYAYVNSFPPWVLKFLLLLVVIMLLFCTRQEIVSEITYDVLGGTLNPPHLTSTSMTSAGQLRVTAGHLSVVCSLM